MYNSKLQFKMSYPNILIIGAGAAGIAAASSLVQNNITNFKILEAENRIGGRVFTAKFGGETVDLGAQWVHGEVNNVAYRLGSAAGLLSHNGYNIRTAQGVLSDGTFIDYEMGVKLYAFCEDILHDETELLKFNGSLGDYFHKRFKEAFKEEHVEIDNDTLKSFLKFLHRFQNSIDGADTWFDTSAKGTTQYYECEGNPLVTWRTGGYSNILQLLMGKNSDTIRDKIVFNKAVRRIEWDRQPVEVYCEDGDVIQTDHVLITVSLGVLKECAGRLFEPSLPPKKLLAIQGLSIGTVNKIFLKFPYRWWPNDCSGFHLLWREEDIPPKSKEAEGWLPEVFTFNSVDNNPLVLCGWLVGPPARLMEQSSDHQVKQACHRLLLRFLGRRYNIPAPESVLRSNWHSNPHFRGSYSFRSVLSDKAGVCAADLAEPLLKSSGAPVVLFGGEASHDHYYSTVHGAVETGWREARRLIAHYSMKRLPKSSL